MTTATPGADGSAPSLRVPEGLPISLGIGLTNACDRSCQHCYRPQGKEVFLDMDTIRRCLDTFDIGSVNLGTGENILNPILPEVLDELFERGIPTSLTSNGKTLLELDAERLGRLHDVEVSFDFADRANMDAFRGRGAWVTGISAAERCEQMGLPVTLLSVLMSTNHDQLAAIAGLAADLGATYRVNVYQPVHGMELMPSHEQFWDAFRRLFAETQLITCTEPVLIAALVNAGYTQVKERGGRCGCGSTSIRLTPSGEILPCVYWPRTDMSVVDRRPVFDDPLLKVAKEEKPHSCGDCNLYGYCTAGCPARRRLTNGVLERDPYCAYLHKGAGVLDVEFGPNKDLLHSANVCTTITQAV